MQEQIMKIFEKLEMDAEVFNEDVMKQIALFVEAQVGEQVNTKTEELTEAKNKEVEEIKEELVNQIDDYLDYFAKEYIKENEDKIVDSVKVNTAARILESMNKFVQDFNITLDEDYIANDEEVVSLKEELNNQINTNIRLENDLRESTRKQLVDIRAKEFEIESERATFVQIAENLEFEGEESFNQNLGFLAEKISTFVDLKTDEVLEETEKLENSTKKLDESTGTNNDNMSVYLRYLK